jgi:hypothetical protein
MASSDKHEGYSFLPLDEKDGDLDLAATATVRRPTRRQTHVSLLVLSILLFASLSTNIYLTLRPNPCLFSTDLPDSRRAIEYEVRTFTGQLTVDSKTGEYVRARDAETEYFGPPSAEIEQAWKDLLRSTFPLSEPPRMSLRSTNADCLKDEFPVLTDDEAKPFLPELTRADSGFYHFEPDVTHSLHCVNAVRLGLTHHTYNVTSEAAMHHDMHHSPTNRVAHMEHCLGRIMQSIMCFGDMSPSPMYPFPDAHVALGRSFTHTCRKWQPIRDWIDERASLGPTLPPL